MAPLKRPNKPDPFFFLLEGEGREALLPPIHAARPLSPLSASVSGGREGLFLGMDSRRGEQRRSSRAPIPPLPPARGWGGVGGDNGHT